MAVTRIDVEHDEELMLLADQIPPGRIDPQADQKMADKIADFEAEMAKWLSNPTVADPLVAYLDLADIYYYAQICRLNHILWDENWARFEHGLSYMALFQGLAPLGVFNYVKKVAHAKYGLCAQSGVNEISAHAIFLVKHILNL